MNNHQPRKRVDIVSLQLVKEASTMYAEHRCNSPQALYNLFAPFADCYFFILMYSKKQCTLLQWGKFLAIYQSSA